MNIDTEIWERQKPADLALNCVYDLYVDVELVRRIQLLYDIWCRYGIHLRERFSKNTNLSWPDFAEVMGSVGVWHIYGHIFECYGRYSTLYSRHTGIIDGEILETLWAILNSILESCRGMSLAHREEVISLFQSDINLRKTLDMGEWASITTITKVLKLCSGHSRTEIQQVLCRKGAA